MKKVYTNKAMNRQKDSSPSFKTLILMGFVILCMVAVKVIYNPADSMEEVAAMAFSQETEETRSLNAED